jgi:choice-of-anchor A domain-containing protein
MTSFQFVRPAFETHGSSRQHESYTVSSALVFPTVLLFTLVVPAIGQASGTHSWCVPGPPMINDNASNDQDTNLVVNHVCTLSAPNSCCDQSSKGRWSLWCVQKGADWLHQTNGTDDCGRFAWAEGPIANTQQYYPRDFNLVTLGGGVSGFRDVHGPVAANGDVQAANGLSLNTYTNEPIALASTGGVNFTSGAVAGDVDNPGSYPPSQSVTYYRGGHHTSTPISSNTFTTIHSSLQTMSNTLNGYTAIPATKSQQKVTFSGSDPELNVFSLASDKITGATTFEFDVPIGSAAIINVSGTNAYFQNAGFMGPQGVTTQGVPSNARILWNFPTTTSLSLLNLSFPGSILAPNASASFNNGQIFGTAVVQSANPEWMELHWVPYHGLAASGCLGWDVSWSCSDDTYLDDSENVIFPAPEAGFFQIDSESYSFKDTESTKTPTPTYTRTSPTHRIWYSFQPAATSPESKPLAVFFNGGPGGSTSSGLFSFNTAPETLDPDWVGGQQIAPNPNSWTQFANLLYVDPPATGFSYPIPTSTGSIPSVGIDIFRDAGAVRQVVIRFLDRHPSLKCNQVMLVGESFGGTRAATMLNHVLNYQTLTTTGIYQDKALHDDLDYHFSTVCPGQSGTQFGSQVLIEPLVAGSLQGSYDYDPQDSIGCVSGGDLYQCNQVDPYDPNFLTSGSAWYWERIQTAATNLTHLATLRTALGVSPATIAWLRPSARIGAYSHGSGDALNFSVSTPDLDSAFGALPSGDSYFVSLSKTVKAPYVNIDGTPAWNDADLAFGTFFLNAVYPGNVKTFITHADHDNAINVLAIQRAFLDTTHVSTSPYPNLVSTCTFDSLFPNSSRPGRMIIGYNLNNASRAIRFPEYANAGHSVSQRMPAQLLTDVIQWYNN